MEFRKISDKTINCIISEQDMSDCGISLEDIFRRKEEAMDFIRGIILQAAEAQDIRLSDEATSMKITVMPDHSLCLVLSCDPKEAPETKVLDAHAENLYIYRFTSFYDLVRCCKHMVSGSRPGSALYEDPEEEAFYLFLYRDQDTGADYERLVLSVNEFAELVTSSFERGAYLMEHLTCLIKENAIFSLSLLSV